MNSRFLTIFELLCLVMANAIPAGALAQPAYPLRPVRFIVPNPPGGGTDLAARIPAQALSARWGQNIIIDNRAGAGGAIGAGLAARAAADGYTLLLGHFPLAVMASADKPAVHLLRDFAPVLLHASTPNALVVRNALAAKTVPEFIVLAKARDGALRYGSGGNGTSMHLCAELFNLLAGARMLHVPYRGAAPALVDVMSAQLDATFASVPAVAPHMKTNRLRALAVTSARRSQSVPQLPTMMEAGLAGYEADQWYGVLVPHATADSVVRQVNGGFIAALSASETRTRMLEAGFDLAGDFSAMHFARFLQLEITKWRKVVHATHLRIE